MRTRILEGADLRLLVDTPGNPFAGRPDVVQQLGNAQVVAVVDAEERLVACWPIWVAVHLEPLWVAEAQRGNPAVARTLVDAMRRQLAAEGITTAFALIGFEDVMTHVPMAARLGFRRMPGDLYFLGVDSTGSTGSPESDADGAADGAADSTAGDSSTTEEGARHGSSGSTGDQPRSAVLSEPGHQSPQRAEPRRRYDGPPRLGE